MTTVLVLAVLVAVLLILAAPIFIGIRYTGPVPEGRLDLDVRLWRLRWPGRRLPRRLAGLCSFRRERSARGLRGLWRLAGRFTGGGRAVRALWREAKPYRPVLYYLIKNARVEEFCWETRVGVGDPGRTGITAGALWAVQGAIAGYLRTRDRGRVRYLVRPDFHRFVFAVDLGIKLRIRLFHALVAGVLALRAWMADRRQARNRR